MIEPLFDRIVILEDEPETKSDNGMLHIPDAAQERVSSGKVISVGPGLVGGNGKIRTPIVKPGDQAVFQLPCGTRIKVNGVTHLLMREGDIHGIMEQ